ncbi:hypothetical protein MA5S0422_0057 [Mycobacteroides abscessus 5S-0422]|uniref:Uncharacterized protein n=1 Tax=Mycobacteroides abscessus subsp. bolletii 1513 TaxID=1299321 RepID=X8DEC8_9MYCO|nr:hypothetical protein [Mycobacteroides abscessus]EIU19681.1 hypothetical protein MA5S0422_0057 [Mycobacteroides abscessus 5S-0422]EIU22435.1 hypothetical protein MA5S0708_4315 [Mycobacteroides abscessus 5S-0708]EUA66977.1 hypothetical protein I540_5813 [Mycobacteroides abscessus subsp. bolletii 1513]
MSYLLETILACAPQASLDARDHWPLHDALRDLDEWIQRDAQHHRLWCSAGLPELHFVTDPDVGYRARGVTKAIWRLVNEGILVCVDGSDGRSRFELDANTVSRIRREVMRLAPDCAAALQRTGQRFAQNAVVAS